MKYIFSIFIGLLFLASCDKTTENLNIDYGYDYYPVELGKYIIYDVDSISYDPSNTVTNIDTTSYQVKEEIVDTTLDNEGRTTYIIHYSTRNGNSGAWTLENVYTTVKDVQWAERTEENLRFVKFIFPQKVGDTWDGNRNFVSEGIFVTVRGETLELFKNWSSAIIDKGNSTTIGALTFDDVITVHHADDENFIEKRFVEEKYARTVGLVEKTIMILDTQCDGNLSNCTDLSWEEKAEKGFILKMTVNTYN
ncbi:MAG: hypothetical protein HC803_02390 [Saprospiraceae bacterium]|nr:hypothetical protein [Saprospiraceae bacterium]